MADISNVKGSFGGNLARGVASGAASGMAGGLMDALFGGVSAGRQWKYYQKQMELQDQYLQAQERRQQAYFEANRDNERNYSSPTAQRSRMAAAGINPFAAEGAGVSSGASLDASSPTGAGVGGNAINGQSRFNVDPLAAAQIEVLRSQADLNNAEAGRARGDTRDPGETLRGQQLTNNLLSENIIGQKTANAQRDFDLEFAQAARSSNLGILSERYNLLQADYLKAMDEHQLNTGRAELLTQQLQFNALDMVLRILEVNSNIELNSARTAELRESASNLVELREKIKQEVNLIRNQSRREGLLADIEEIDKANRNGYWSAELSLKWANVVGTYVSAGKDVSTEIRRWLVPGSR